MKEEGGGVENGSHFWSCPDARPCRDRCLAHYGLFLPASLGKMKSKIRESRVIDAAFLFCAKMPVFTILVQKIYPDFTMLRYTERRSIERKKGGF